jgi:hypothetical protein
MKCCVLLYQVNHKADYLGFKFGPPLTDLPQQVYGDEMPQIGVYIYSLPYTVISIQSVRRTTAEAVCQDASGLRAGGMRRRSKKDSDVG